MFPDFYRGLANLFRCMLIIGGLEGEGRYDTSSLPWLWILFVVIVCPIEVCFSRDGTAAPILKKAGKPHSTGSLLTYTPPTVNEEELNKGKTPYLIVQFKNIVFIMGRSNCSAPIPPPGQPRGQRKNECDKKGRGNGIWSEKGRGNGKWRN